MKVKQNPWQRQAFSKRQHLFRCQLRCKGTTKKPTSQYLIIMKYLADIGK